MARSRRDYAKRTTTRKQKPSVPGWLWMVGGLSVGLLIAFLVYLQQQSALRDVSGTGTGPATTDTRVVPPPTARPPAAPQRQQPLASVEPAPRQGVQFDFYNILPELEIVIPETELRREGTDQQHTYYLQVGSFRRDSDAESRKVELIMLNFEPVVQTVTVDGNQTWHRVRIGPFSDRRRLDQARRRLQENGIDFIMLRERS